VGFAVMSNNSGRPEFSGPTFSGLVTSPTTLVQNLPTLTCVRAGLVNVSGLSCLNIICDGLVTIDASTLVNTQSLLLVATGGVVASIALSNKGTIAGSLIFKVNPGPPASLTYDGTNLNLN
jgi:hypothetical protein